MADMAGKIGQEAIGLLQAVSYTWSIQEFVDAYRGLDDVELARITQAAAVFARIAQVNVEDLLQEAVTRVLEGRRRWPKDLPLAAFLIGAARSIASGEKRYRERGEVRAPLSVYGRDGDVEHHAQEESRSPEEEIIAEEQASLMMADMEALFADDVAAWTIYSGMVEGLRGKALREATGLDITEFATKRRLVRRRLNPYSVKRKERP